MMPAGTTIGSRSSAGVIPPGLPMSAIEAPPISPMSPRRITGTSQVERRERICKNSERTRAVIGRPPRSVRSRTGMCLQARPSDVSSWRTTRCSNASWPMASRLDPEMVRAEPFDSATTSPCSRTISSKRAASGDRSRTLSAAGTREFTERECVTSGPCRLRRPRQRSRRPPLGLTREEDRPTLEAKSQEPSKPADALGVQAVRRLVQDKNFGIAQQRPGEPEPLTHPE